MQIKFEMWLSELDIRSNVKQFIMIKILYQPINYFSTIKNTRSRASPVLEVLDAPYCTNLEEGKRGEPLQSSNIHSAVSNPYLDFFKVEDFQWVSCLDIWMSGQQCLSVCLSGQQFVYIFLSKWRNWKHKLWRVEFPVERSHLTIWRTYFLT